MAVDRVIAYILIASIVLLLVFYGQQLMSYDALTVPVLIIAVALVCCDPRK